MDFYIVNDKQILYYQFEFFLNTIVVGNVFIPFECVIFHVTQA